MRLTRNVAAITMDFDDIERLDVRALRRQRRHHGQRPDRHRPRRARTSTSAPFDGGGDGAADTVIVNGTDRADRVRVTRIGPQVLTTGLAAQTTIAGSEGVNDTLRINTLDGRDDVTVDPNASC